MLTHIKPGELYKTKMRIYGYFDAVTKINISKGFPIPFASIITILTAHLPEDDPGFVYVSFLFQDKILYHEFEFEEINECLVKINTN